MPKLTPDELTEFRLRKAMLDYAQVNHNMISESYVAWTQRIKEKYGLTAQYDIDLRTGRLRAQKDGRPTPSRQAKAAKARGSGSSSRV